MPAFDPQRPEPLVFPLDVVDILIGEPEELSVSRRRRRINANDYPSPILAIGRRLVVARVDIDSFLERKRELAEVEEAKRKARAAAAVAGRQVVRAERAARGDTQDPGLVAANRVRQEREQAKRHGAAAPTSAAELMS